MLGKEITWIAHQVGINGAWWTLNVPTPSIHVIQGRSCSAHFIIRSTGTECKTPPVWRQTSPQKAVQWSAAYPCKFYSWFGKHLRTMKVINDLRNHCEKWDQFHVSSVCQLTKCGDREHKTSLRQLVHWGSLAFQFKSLNPAMFPDSDIHWWPCPLLDLYKTATIVTVFHCIRQSLLRGALHVAAF